jgi:hypothetical protein
MAGVQQHSLGEAVMELVEPLGEQLALVGRQIVERARQDDQALEVVGELILGVFRYGSVCGEIRIGQVLLEQTAIHFLGESVVARQPRQVPSSPSNLSHRFAAFCGGSPPGSIVIGWR